MNCFLFRGCHFIPFTSPGYANDCKQEICETIFRALHITINVRCNPHQTLYNDSYILIYEKWFLSKCIIIDLETDKNKTVSTYCRYSILRAIYWQLIKTPELWLHIDRCQFGTACLLPMLRFFKISLILCKHSVLIYIYLFLLIEANSYMCVSNPQKNMSLL